MQSIVNPVNLRDLGGLVGFAGRKIKTKRLIRAGQPVGLTKEEKKIFTEKINLNNIIDFRDEREIAKEPDDIFSGATYHHIDIMKGVSGGALSFENIVKNCDANDMHKLMIDVYSGIILNEDAQKGYRQFLDILHSEQTGATMFHCFAGKDRTGIAAAIILSILGVSYDEILKDYLKTNEQRKVDNDRLIADLIKEGIPKRGQEALAVGLTVCKDFIEHAFSVATENYGSFDGYIKTALGVTNEEKSIFQKLYLE